MENKEITVSYIVTVFNKASYIAATARSILQQEGAHTREFIFVDDVSTDGSVEILEEITRGLSNVTIIKNTVNAGPSIRLNQAARLARGTYLHFFDSDDILPANASNRMLQELIFHKADMIYGRWLRTQEEGSALLGRRTLDDAPCTLSLSPLETVLSDHFVRMALMVKRDVFIAAGGCDERVFIQDESLPLRLAAHAKRFLTLEAPVLFVPKIDGALSGNKSQLNHDRFLANRNMLLAGADNISEKSRRLLYRRCVSAAWKQCRQRNRILSHFSSMFVLYCMNRTKLRSVDLNTLKKLSAFFAKLEGVRRVPHS